MRFIVLTVCLLFFIHSANAKSEADYQNEWCQGQTEVELKDLTRVDCLTGTHAIEIEWAANWKEAIGQSLHYALMTGKSPGIALIFKKPGHQRYRIQLEAVLEASGLDIKIWDIPAILDK